jgi:hypothetical protein
MTAQQRMTCCRHGHVDVISCSRFIRRCIKLQCLLPWESVDLPQGESTCSIALWAVSWRGLPLYATLLLEAQYLSHHILPFAVMPHLLRPQICLCFIPHDGMTNSRCWCIPLASQQRHNRKPHGFVNHHSKVPTMRKVTEVHMHTMSHMHWLRHPGRVGGDINSPTHGWHTCFVPACTNLAGVRSLSASMPLRRKPARVLNPRCPMLRLIRVCLHPVCLALCVTLRPALPLASWPRIVLLGTCEAVISHCKLLEALYGDCMDGMLALPVRA